MFDARTTRRIGVQTLDALRKDALRGYAGSGFVIAGPSPVVLAGRGPGATGRDAVAAQSTTMNIQATGTGSDKGRQAVMIGTKAAFDHHNRFATLSFERQVAAPVATLWRMDRARRPRDLGRAWPLHRTPQPYARGGGPVAAAGGQRA